MSTTVINNITTSRCVARNASTRQGTLTSLAETTFEFVKEKPLVASGTFCTFLTFCTTVIGQTALRYTQVFGLSSIVLFGLQIFASSKSKSQTNQ